MIEDKKKLLCAVMNIVECQPGGQCQQVTAEEVGIPNFLRIDFQKKQLSATFGDGSKKHSEIENLEKIDGKVILQGAEDGIEASRQGPSGNTTMCASTFWHCLCSTLSKNPCRKY